MVMWKIADCSVSGKRALRATPVERLPCEAIDSVVSTRGDSLPLLCGSEMAASII